MKIQHNTKSEALSLCRHSESGPAHIFRSHRVDGICFLSSEVPICEGIRESGKPRCTPACKSASEIREYILKHDVLLCEDCRKLLEEL